MSVHEFIGPKGQRSKLDESNRLQVLNKEAEDRMMILARDFTRNSLQDADYEEFQWLHGQYQASLHRMAIDAKGTLVAYLVATMHALTETELNFLPAYF